MPFSPDRLGAICFDIDGTLRNTDDEFVIRMASVIRPAALIFPHRDAMGLARRIVMATENPGNLVLTLGDRLGIDALISHLGDLIYRLGSARSRSPGLLIDGVRDMLEQLQAKFPLAIISSRSHRVTMDFLNQYHLLSFFQFIATNQTCRHAKPWPDPLLRAASELHVPPQACLMVGDTTIDIRAGKACGAQTAGVLCGFGDEKELRQAGADLILASTPDLIKYIYPI